MNNDPIKTTINSRLFVNTSNDISQTQIFSFSRAMELLTQGKCLTRKAWDGKCIIYEAYDLLTIDNEIKYTKHLQSCTLERANERWIPENDDLFANDWKIVLVGDEDIPSNNEPVIRSRPRIKS